MSEVVAVVPFVMNSEGIRELMHAAPFQPFEVRLGSGKTVAVLHPDYALLTPDGRRLFVTADDSSVEILDVFSIESVALAAAPAGEPATG